MNANWITASGNPDVFPAEVAGRRFMVLTLGAAALALAGCDAMDADAARTLNNEVQNARYFQNRETGACYSLTGSGSTRELNPLDCTPQVLAAVAKEDRRR